MELVIIALIAVEVVVVRDGMSPRTFSLISPQALIRDGPELWHMLHGTDSKNEHIDDRI